MSNKSTATLSFEVVVLDDRLTKQEALAYIDVDAGTPVNKAVQKISRAIQRRIKKAESEESTSEELI